jgi:hypothetical protein
MNTWNAWELAAFALLCVILLQVVLTLVFRAYFVAKERFITRLSRRMENSNGGEDFQGR